MTIRQFQHLVLGFYRDHGRENLPWRGVRDPYAILVSEIMLQQTQVSRGIERFPRFLKRFPTIKKLAKASQVSVLKAWLGLGYNRRALNLHRAAKEVVSKFDGRIPSDPNALMTLPGIGAYTANAVAAFAFNKPVVFLDTNIRRVFLYHFFKLNKNSEAKKKVSDIQIVPIIERALYRKNPRLWYSALMDYGALGSFGENPNRSSSHYVKQSQFEGSRRSVRAKIVSLLLTHVQPCSLTDVERRLGLKYKNKYRVADIMHELCQEGFIVQKHGLWSIAK